MWVGYRKYEKQFPRVLKSDNTNGNVYVLVKQ